jgi:hypothetical protein
MDRGPNPSGIVGMAGSVPGFLRDANSNNGDVTARQGQSIAALHRLSRLAHIQEVPRQEIHHDSQ